MTKKQCTGGQCDSSKFKHIMSSLEKVFCGGNMQFFWKACRWIEHQSKLSGQHIHDTLCGHGGKSCMVIGKNKEILVNGYDPKTSTVYQFYQYKWHGCPCSGYASDKYQNTLSMESQIQSLGHNAVSIWECENPELTRMHLQKEFVPYPYFIMYNFKVLLMTLQSAQTSHLMLASAHVPVSVAIKNNLTNEPTCFENINPETLI